MHMFSGQMKSLKSLLTAQGKRDFKSSSICPREHGTESPSADFAKWMIRVSDIPTAGSRGSDGLG